jgi:hypothetical protein
MMFKIVSVCLNLIMEGIRQTYNACLEPLHIPRVARNMKSRSKALLDPFLQLVRN